MNHRHSILILQSLNSLIQLLDPHNEIGDRVKKPVEDQCGRDQEGIALTLHDGFLVAQVLRRGARVTLATRASLVLPVDVHEQEEAKGYHREEGFEEVPGHGDQPLAEAVEAGDGEEKDHDGLCTRGVA
ncbi:hypothetical protein L6164_026689 [Bauhinia variegata]|uniref:Uncharacterized protein n=1 Tax=Bauhinia variegata TaxID=167791 RepID=A0ACB9LRT6_BAUVA|nr:hypothetical protein L6164_026689 [Bauhinia variegata]